MIPVSMNKFNKKGNPQGKGGNLFDKKHSPLFTLGDG